MLSALYLDLVIEAPLKLPVYHVHCVAIPTNTCMLYVVWREEIMFLDVCRHFAAKLLLNRMQRVSLIRYNIIAKITNPFLQCGLFDINSFLPVPMGFLIYTVTGTFFSKDETAAGLT